MSSQTSPLEFKRILYVKKGSIAYVTFNRPRVFNALDTALIAERKEAFEDCRDDSAVRGVILSGAGDKAFAAGADISEFVNDTAADLLAAIADARSGQRDLSDRLQSQDAQKNRRATLVVRSRLAADWHSS